MSKRSTYSLLGVTVLLVAFFALSGIASATTFTTPVDADYGDITNSVYLSQDDFPDGASAAVLVGSDSYSTALASTVLAEAADGPLLYTSTASLSASARTELIRLRVSKVYIVGLSTTIVDAVKAALPGLAADEFVVLSGADHYQTAARVANQVKVLAGTPERVFIVPGDVYGSSLSAAAVAAANAWPILLTPQAGPFPAYSAQAISDLGVHTGIRVDTNVNPGFSGFSIEKTIMGTTSPSDDPGNRYTECLEMAEYAVEEGWVTYGHVGIGEEQGGSVAFSLNFPDNVLLASHIARVDGAYLLTKSTGLHADVADALEKNGEDIDCVAFMRPDYDEIVEMGLGSWSFAAVRQAKSLNSPRITGLSSASGPLAGGGALTVTGTGFNDAETVRIGKTNLSQDDWHVNSDTSLTIESMPAATQPGAVEIFVSNYWHLSPSNPSDVYFYTGGGTELVAMDVVQEAVKFLGKPYLWAGASPSKGFDCSGLTMYVYNKFTSLTGVTLPHKSTYQASYGAVVAKEDLLPGDLVFFGSPIGHVGMYVGNGLMINAPRSGDLVCIEDVFRSNYVTARRLVSPYSRIEQSSSLLGYAGPWTLAASSSSASAGSYSYVDSPGASVTVEFNGTYLEWISKKSTAYGLARVTVDGVDAGTVNLYSSNTLYQQKVWDTGMLSGGTHTVTISWTGTSGGSGGGTNIGIDAFDVIGTYLQAQATGTPSRYEDTHRNVIYSGLWDSMANSSASGGCFRSIDASGSASVTFDGTAVAWVASKGPGYGIGRVKLDGVTQGTIDLYSASPGYATTVWRAEDLDEGTHTLTVEWTGTKNAASSDADISLDAFDVMGDVTAPAGLTRYEQSDDHLVYDGSWYKFTASLASYGSYDRANTDASVTVHFTGTYLSWVATTGTTLGMAQVSLDGGPAQTVDLSRPAVAYQQSVWATGILADGGHTVKISWGGDTGKYVSIDAFEAMGSLTDGGASSSSVTYEQTDDFIVKVGNWSDFIRAAASGGSYGRADGAGSSATICFTGTRLDWIAMMGTTTGIADVYLDEEFRTTIDLSASYAIYDVMVWSTGALLEGQHTVRIEMSEHNPAGKYITLDAVDVVGTLTENTAALPSITDLDPSSDSTAGGTTVTISGTSFESVSAVTFGDEEATDFTVVSPTMITAVAPPHDAGAVDVKVTTAIGTNEDTAADDFTYTEESSPDRYEQTDSNIVKTGVWYEYPKALASGGSYGRSATDGASATIYFNGTKFDWIAMKGTTTGSADVYLDGVRKATVSLASSPADYEVNVWSTGTLPAGEHNVRIVRSSASATASNITLDAVDIVGTISAPPTRYEQTDDRISKVGYWTDYVKAVASGGSYGRSSASGATATIYFTGTRLDWVGMKGTTTGSADVYVDGTKVATVDLAASSAVYDLVVWSTGTLPYDDHTVRIERVGGNALNVTLDAVDIWGTLRSGP